MKPAVSVLMSVHNQAEYLDASFKSILAQTFTQFEFVIVDDHSNRETRERLHQYHDSRIKIIHNRRRLGLARSLNRGLTFCRGKYIARMDADDIAHPSRIKKQYKYLENHQNLAGCGTWVSLIDEQGKKTGSKHFPTQSALIKKVILRYSPFIHPSVMIRKKIIAACGGYDANLNGAEDYDLWLRIVSQHQMVNLPEELLRYRVNPRGISWSQLKHLEWQALRARFKSLRHYPAWQIVYLFKPALSFLIPERIKKKIFGI